MTQKKRKKIKPLKYDSLDIARSSQRLEVNIQIALNQLRKAVNEIIEVLNDQ